MSTPIKREDIRNGDRIRKTNEFTAGSDWLLTLDKDATYELIERPVTPPSEPGVYLNTVTDLHYFLSEGGDIWCLDNMDGHGGGGPYSPLGYDRDAFTLLRPVAEVAAEVLEEVRRELMYGNFGMASLNVGTKYGVTL